MYYTVKVIYDGSWCVKVGNIFTSWTNKKWLAILRGIFYAIKNRSWLRVCNEHGKVNKEYCFAWMGRGHA